jgi:hypothetical protein
MKRMTRIAKPTTEESGHSIRTKMIRNAMACNKHLTWQFLRFKDNRTLLCFCHPTDRFQFEVDLGIRKGRESTEL